MRATSWKNLFKQKGWWDGKCILPQKDICVYLLFSENHYSFELNSIIEVTDDFLVYQDPDDLEATVVYLLWEDIVSVSVSMRDD